MNHPEHVHPCGHPCACALPDAELCVHEALYATDSLGERQAIWEARWPADHRHSQNLVLPPDRQLGEEPAPLVYLGPVLPEQHRP